MQIDDDEGDGSCSSIVEPDSLDGVFGPLEKRNNHANERISEVLKEVTRQLAEEYNRNALAQWAYETNVNQTTQELSVRKPMLWQGLKERVTRQLAEEYNRNALAHGLTRRNVNQTTQELSTRASLRAIKAERRLIAKLNRTLREFDLKDACPDVQRQVAFLLKMGPSALSDRKYTKLGNIVKTMETIYSTATICEYKNCDECGMRLEPEITERMATSRNPDELLYLWTAWRNATGRKMRKYYPDYVDLMNEASYLNNYCDTAFEWLTEFDPLQPDEMKSIAKKLWKQVEPLYKQLHAYVRYKLRCIYGERLIPVGGCIPAHLLGNMWAQTWTNLFNETMPFPDHKLPDITAAMTQKGYTPEKMFRLAEKFFVSLNMSAMPTSFWNNSIISRPNEDIKMFCHASAWDMYDGKDFRIKMCAEVTYENFVTIHHEMGHVQYYLQYKDLPLPYREGANPGFHEAIGDTIALSVVTMCHLKKIGLVEQADHCHYEEHEKRDLNFLMRMALEKVAFLPFGYLVDLWRWDVFESNVMEQDYNKHWWKLRDKYQGICPPLQRTEKDFDPGAKYHIAAGVPYLRYFISFVLQFQFHSALCQRAGQYVDSDDEDESDGSPFLYRCDIYGCPGAGEQLSSREALSLGCSRPWPDVMRVLTNEDTMDATALLKYFEPLHRFLKRENKRNNEEIGWGKTVPCSDKL
ncbi:angiotensin-converting enzyme-like [Ctenocephalides felis]|uniref:angiotensin-converting enzyme-like n=1 Tax=Ctenocephalides felis TaxID=7515 RepID=UPI000E6E5B58|nr:angiotensin-converting enzyme-like [Ctenocephalides felis]